MSLPRAVCWTWRRATTAPLCAGVADEGGAPHEGSAGGSAVSLPVDSGGRRPLLVGEVPEVLAAGGEEGLPCLGWAARSSVGSAQLQRVKGSIRDLLVGEIQRADSAAAN